MWRKIIKDQALKSEISKGEIKAVLWMALGFVAIWESAKAWYNNGCDVTSGIVTTAANNLGVTSFGVISDLFEEIKRMYPKK